MTRRRHRFAPSPSGAMHVGNLRTALAAWLAARADRGTIVLRIEDLDTPRVRAGAEGSIVDDLRWLGLDWDEGPDLGGPFAPYRQSERRALYASALERLRADGLAYACSCSRAEVAASAPHGPSGETVYGGRCARRSESEVIAEAAANGRSPAWRFRVPADPVEWDDALFGRRVESLGETVGDFVIARSDGITSYQLAVVVDDRAMEITDVWRGADLVPSTARQIALRRALGDERSLRWGHVPLVLAADAAKLSKRNRPETVADLRTKGIAAPRLAALLARSLGLAAPAEAAPRDLVALWDPSRIGRTDEPLEL